MKGARWSTRLAALLLLTGLCVLAGAAVAWADPSSDALRTWQPAASGGPAWQLVGQQLAGASRYGTCGEDSDKVWERPDRGYVALVWSACSTSHLAAQLFTVIRQERTPLRPLPGGVLLGGVDRADTVLHGEGVLRYWAQGSADVMFTVGCAGPVNPRCLGDSAAMAKEISATLPGRPLPAGAPTGRDYVSGLLTLPFAFWLLVLGLPRTLNRLREPRYASVSGPGYQDVRGRISELKTRRALRRFLAALGAIAVLTGMGGIFAANLIVSGMGFLVAIGLLLLRTRLADPLLIRHHAPTRAGRGKQMAARVFSALSSGASVFALLMYVPFVVVAQYAAVDPGWSGKINPHLLNVPLAVFFLVLVELTRGSPELFFVFFLLPVVILAFLFNRLAQRLTSLSAREVLAGDTRRYFLYLRSFDEDRLKTRVSLTRSGLLSFLAPLRRRRFEEVMVRSLSRFGPVIAISPPGQRLPALGAAKTSVDHQHWREQVETWARDAQFVVLSGTPASVRAGFGWEIELVARRMGHNRVLVVFAPWKKSQLHQRIGAFLGHVSRWNLFAPLASLVQDGAHVAVHTDDRGWRLYGAPRRSDWSYTVCVDEALRPPDGGGSPAQDPLPRVESDLSTVGTVPEA